MDQPNLRLEFYSARRPRGTRHPGNFLLMCQRSLLGVVSVAQKLENTLQPVCVHVHVDTVEMHLK